VREEVRFVVVHASQLVQQQAQTAAAAPVKEAEAVADHVRQVHTRWCACRPDAEAAIAKYEGRGQGRRGRQPRPWRYHMLRYGIVAESHRSYTNNMQGWGPELCARRPDITMAMVETFLSNMYGGARADFVYTVTRDFVRQCQTPILVLPDDVPAHPYAVAMETVHLAPHAQVSLYPWKDTPDKIPLAVRHIRTFLRAHQPVTVTH